MLKKIAHFSTGNIYSGFNENEDGSITKSALVFVEGEHQDNRGRTWTTNSSFIEKLVENTNRAFEEGRHIPILKDHVKTVDAEIGVLDAPLEARIITEDDLPNKKHKDLIGKIGVFCDGLVLRAKDVVERVKQGLNKTLSPGIDMGNIVLKEISLTPTPAIKSLSLFSAEGSTEDMPGVYTLDDAEALEQDEEDMKEEFMELSCKFYCVVKNILNAGDELADQSEMLIEKAFEDYEMRVRELFGLDGEEFPDEDETVSDVQRNGYSLSQAPGMVTPDFAPYSLYAGDEAEFGFLDNVGKALGRTKNVASSAFGYARRGRWDAAKGTLGNYFTKEVGDVNTKKMKRIANWGNIGTTAGVLGATGAAGYGAYRGVKAGLGAVGIGRKEEPKPWYRRNPFN